MKKSKPALTTMITAKSRSCSSAMIFLLFVSGISFVSSQSNYATHGNNIGYLGEGLPEEATLDGKVGSLILYSKFLLT